MMAQFIFSLFKVLQYSGEHLLEWGISNSKLTKKWTQSNFDSFRVITFHFSRRCQLISKDQSWQLFFSYGIYIHLLPVCLCPYMYKYPRRNTVAQVELEINACYTVSSQHCGSKMNLFFFLVLILQLLIYYTAVSSILQSKNNDENVKQPTGSSQSHHYRQKKFLMMLSLQTLLLSFV